MARQVRDLASQRFGKLVVLELAEVKKAARWLCRCDCGGSTVVTGSLLVRGKTKSCGCAIRDANQLRARHNMRNSREYRVWRAMKRRCYAWSDGSYPNYGGRGIKVCDEWRDSFEAFYRDMGPRPSLKHSIDRINPNGNYEPNNCRWATMDVQNSNKRNTKMLIVDDISIPLAWIAKISGIKTTTIEDRIRRGWGVLYALGTPVRKRQSMKDAA